MTRPVEEDIVQVDAVLDFSLMGEVIGFVGLEDFSHNKEAQVGLERVPEVGTISLVFKEKVDETIVS